jgi:hypothetical protein
MLTASKNKEELKNKWALHWQTTPEKKDALRVNFCRKKMPENTGNSGWVKNDISCASVSYRKTYEGVEGCILGWTWDLNNTY